MRAIIVVLLLCACAPKNSTVEVGSQDMLRDSMAWKASTPWWSTDLNTTIKGDQLVHWVLAYDQECESAVNLDGNGNMQVAFSIQLSQAQPSDTSCSMFDGTWTYSGDLTICQQGQSCITLSH